jgi:TonB family protein
MLIKSRILLSIALLSITLSVSAQDDVGITHLLDPAGERKPLQTVVPVYPERALTDRVQGDVQVCFNIDREGRTSRISVRNSSHRMFEKPSVLAVRASSYVPLAENKIMSGIKTCRIFRFRLDPVAIEDPIDLSDPSISVEP